MPRRLRLPGALARALRAELRRRADPAKAEPMQRYMKSAMPLPRRDVAGLRAMCREVFARIRSPEPRPGATPCSRCGATRSRREERYAAIELAGAGAPTRRTARSTLLPMLEEMIVDGAWWDLVDPVATHRLRELLRALSRSR